MTIEQLKEYAHSNFTFKLNYLKIPCTIFDMNDDGMNKWNEMVDLVHSLKLSKLIRTKSGGISIDVRNWEQFPGYDCRASKSMVELTLITVYGCYRFQFRNDFKDKDKDDISGHKAFETISNLVTRYGGDINSLRITTEEGLEVKNQIPSPIIDLAKGWEDITVRNVHHIDIHSAHMAGVAKDFPTLREAIRYCYIRRKEKPVYKGVLTHCWGYFQSSYSPVYYQFSHLSKAGIEFTNATVNELTKRLEESGRLVLMHNTDGIWYSGDIYHGDGEGDFLGEWSNDYNNCRFRAKSKGCYEFEGYDKHGNYIYKAVVRGLTTLDKIKNRDDWVWGDIYKAGDVIQYYYDPETEYIRRAE